MSRFHLALLTVGAVAVAGLVTWRIRQSGGSPVDSLRQLAEAARARDRRAIEQYLDVTRTAESVVDEAFSATAAIAAAAPSHQEDSVESIPLLITAVELSIWATLLDSLPILSDRYQGIADVEQRERVARVGIRMRREYVDSSVVVHLRMERADGHWRVVGIEDLGPYMRASLARRLDRAYEAAMRSDLRNLVTAQAMYFADHGTYAPSLRALGYATTLGVSVEIVEATGDGWRAVARHQRASSECRIAIGAAVPAGDVQGQPKCSRAGRP